MARIGGDFTTTILARNGGSEDGTITLLGYDSEGNLIEGAEEDRRVVDHGFMTEALDSIFGELTNLSHVGISDSADVKVSMGYKAADGNGATAHLNEQSAGVTTWFFYPGEADLVFDGIAVLNLGNAATAVTVRLREKDGRIRDSKILAEALGPKAKALGILSVLFADSEGAMVEVEGDEPLLIIALRGSEGDGPAYLYESVATSNL